ncbi:MAG: purine-nucleoside phosphorylase [Acidimicrobiales bacterium]
MTNPYERAASAATTIRARLGDDLRVAVVLGSGWVGVAEGLGDTRTEIALHDLPGVPAPTVAGHSGVARAVDVGGVATLVLGGRSHLYEGHPVDTVVHTVRAAVLAGCSTIVLTNACGSLDPSMGVGQPVLLSDQLNLTGANPMCGDEPPAGYPGRFCDLTEIYSRRLREAARAVDPTLPEGVYAGMLGGSYETPAEIRMLRTLGADLVGMSTVLEAIAARHLGAEVAGVSLVTNLAAGMGQELSHADVLDAGRASADRLMSLVAGIVASASAD